jgi:hypothetical protein
MYHAYFICPYYQLQKTNELTLHPLAKSVNLNTNENDVVLIYGLDWSSELPYYSQRKTLMDRWNMPLQNDKFQLALKALADEKIAAMVVAGEKRNDPLFINQRIRKFNLSPRPVYQDSFADLYIAQSPPK